MLALSFFVIAIIYSSVGFGGGSSYIGMLALSDTPYELTIKLGLICNILVVANGCRHYLKRGLLKRSLILPFALSSVPFSFLGGMYKISQKDFLVLLSICLIVAGVRLLFVLKDTDVAPVVPRLRYSAPFGMGLGLLSGLVGIGGGVFLSPLMLNFKWAKPQEVAATASAFILFNSIAGLMGQLTKGNNSDLINYWPLFIAVITGGLIGARVGTSHKFSTQYIQKATAILILYIAIKLLTKVFA